MAKKQFFCIVDTETTNANTVADFAAVIVDRQGIIHNRCAIIVKGEFEKGLFYDVNNKDWSIENAKIKAAKYQEMLINGSRMMASVAAINRWLDKAIGQYNPILTAYNLAFDVEKCQNTAIDLTGFSDRFCLWAAAVGNICQTKKYRQFVLENHRFNKPTEKGNMTFSTNAETVAGFLNNQMVTEPHTALEDVIDFELPILKALIKKKNWRNNCQPYDWRQFQVKDGFIAK
jgi:hypothetical protein